MQTISAIDVGSNAIRMAVGRVSPDQSKMEVIENVRIPVRLGQDVFSKGFIGKPSMQAALDTFLRFRQMANAHEVNHIRAVATSAMREAENGNVLVERIAEETGISIEIISGEEEARLIHFAISKVIDLQNKKALLIDIGGGSIEVAISRGDKLLTTESYDMGTVRLLRKLDDAVPRNFRVLLSEYTESARLHIKREVGKLKLDVCVGTGGNIEEMGNLRKRLLNRDSSTVITVSELEELDEKLSKMTVDRRIKKLNLRPDRADVIVPAIMVLRMIAREAHIKEIQIPGVGLKDGLLWEMVRSTPGPDLPRHEQARTSAMRLGHKYQFDGEHAVRVERTAQSLFDQTASLHNLEEEQRLILEIASLLHDIGHFIGTLNHDKHGYYILKNSPLIGLDEHQQEMVAVLIRSHRKVVPADMNDVLTQKDLSVLTRLCALLRLADAIEVSHTARIHGVKLEKNKKCWQLHLNGDGNLLLERWAIEKRKSLFEETFDTLLEVLE